MTLVSEEFTPGRRHKRDRKRNVTVFDPVYRVVDADTGRVMDDNRGYGFANPDAALSEWRRRVRSPRFAVESWMEAHPAAGALLFETVVDTEIGRYGDTPVDDAFVAMVLEPLGLESPVPADVLCRMLDRLWDKYRAGEICDDSSLADQYRTNRARAILDRCLEQPQVSSRFLPENHKERKS